MKLYKLKKDTFFYKAGTICKITPKGNLVLNDCKGTCILHDYQLKERPGLLEDWFDEVKATHYGGRTPREGDHYWFITNDEVSRDRWDELFCDKVRFLSGNAFWTEEEAKAEVIYRKAYAILKEDAKGFRPNWKDQNYKWHVVYDHKNEELRPTCDITISMPHTIYFATRDDTIASIAKHRDEWLNLHQKYYEDSTRSA